MNEKRKFNCWQCVVLLLLLECGGAWLTLAQTSSQVIPAIPAGYEIVEGDIVMPSRVVQAMRQAEARGVAAAPEANYGGRLWPNNGLVLYQFQTTCAPSSTCIGAPPSGCVSPADQARMRAAMDEVEKVSAVRFRQCTGNRCPSNFNYLNIRDSTNDFGPVSEDDNRCVSTAANNSSVGMVGNSGQNVNITDWTFLDSSGMTKDSTWVIVHELLHALGMYHEQARRDRDTYIRANCGSVKGGCMGSTFDTNFSKLEGIDYGPYDFDSLMHYGECAFTISSNCRNDATLPDGGRTVVVKPPYATQLSPDGVTPWQTAIGQRTHLSTLDTLIISFLYPRGNWRFVGNPLPYPTDFLVRTGAFLAPYETLDAAVMATPVGGVIWLQPGTYTLRDTLTKRVTLRAPLGGVTIRQGTPTTFGLTLASVSAASYEGELAADSMVAAFGANLANGTAAATAVPLPTTLAGVTIKVTDSKGVTRDAPLFFVSPAQINYLIPPDTSPGLASVVVYKGNVVGPRGEAIINPSAPALFTANATGQGVPAATLLRLRADGSQRYEALARYDAAQQRFVPIPIDLGPEGEQVFLILFGTGFRRRTELAAVTASIGEEFADVLYAGTAPGFVGLDQANVRLPRTLSGKGNVPLSVRADNRASNTVTINVR